MDVRFTFLKENDRDTAIYQNALDALAPHIAQPIPGSEFDYVVRAMGSGSPKSKIIRLMPQGFDALLGVKDDKIISFLALKHKSARKPTAVFRVYTAPEYERNGIARKSVEYLVNTCFEQGQNLLYVSRGKSEAVSAVLRSLQKNYQGPYTIGVQPETGLITRLYTT
jgi:GNAT superfamily N-acetyltransferase